MTRPAATATLPRLLAGLAAGLAAGPAALALDVDRPEVQAYVNELVKEHGLDADYLLAMLGGAEAQQSILDAMARPAEKTKPWSDYRAIFLTRERIDAGVKFWREQEPRLLRVAQATGVPPEMLVGIVGVETYFGQRAGKFRLLDSLATLAFEYPPRAKFFRGELTQLFLLARDDGIEIDRALGSYAGAMGAPQFMPSSYRRFAVDGSADRRRNLFTDWDDVIASVANYLKVHGWQPGEPVLVDAAMDDSGLMAALDPRNLDLLDTVGTLRARGIRFEAPVPASTPAILLPAELEDRPNVRVGFRNFHVITRYNRSIRYAMAVHDLAEKLSERVFAAEPAGAEAGGRNAQGS